MDSFRPANLKMVSRTCRRLASIGLDTILKLDKLATFPTNTV